METAVAVPPVIALRIAASLFRSCFPDVSDVSPTPGPSPNTGECHEDVFTEGTDTKPLGRCITFSEA